MAPDPSDTGSSSSNESLIFVSDASAEAEKLTAVLRSRGYVVVDVPLALLLSRVGVQRPAIVLCDADAPSAVEIIERMRDVPGGAKVDVLFFGERERVLNEQAERIARQASAIFPRPVDSVALSVKVETLVGPPRGGSNRPSSLLPQGNRVPVLVAATRRPYRYDTRARARNLPDPGESRASAARPEQLREDRTNAPFQAVPQDLIGEVNQQLRGLSSDLQALLGRAEERVQESRGFLLGSERLSPEAELEAVLPSDLLSALDEPLDELDDDEDDDVGTPGTHGSDSHASKSGSGSRPGPESTPGTAPGGSVNPFAPREITTSGGDHGERSPSEHAEIDPARERTANGSEGGSLSRREHSTLATNLRGRTSPPSTPLVDTALAALAVGRGDRNSMPTDLRVTSEPPKPTEVGNQALDNPETPPKQVSTKPPRGGRRDGEPPEIESPRELESARDFARHLHGDSDVAPPTPHQSAIPASSAEIEIPATLRSGDAIRILARAVRARYSGAIAFEDDGGVRRVVLRDGDFVMAAAGIDNESLTAFLAQRGDLPADVAARLGRKLPQFGRHAGAALIAQGHLRQEDLWPVLRAHAEWLITRIATLAHGAAGLERVVSARLSSEPSVFGGATGAEVLLEVVRRAVPPNSALAWLGGPGAELSPGVAQSLLAECALGEAELGLVRMASSGATVGELMERSGNHELPTVLFSLVELGVLHARPSARRAPQKPRPPTDVIDHEAVRARIRARRALVDEGDYFSLLGVTRNATSYDIRRAYTSLLQEFEPSRILTPLTTDLQEDVDVILEVLDEAYEILRDEVRRERYLHALEDAPR